MLKSEMEVRRLVERGYGRTIKVSDDLTAWVHHDADDNAHVHVGSKRYGRIVFEAEINTYTEVGHEAVENWLHKRRHQHEATLIVAIQSGTAYIKDNGKVLEIMLVSKTDKHIDEATIPHANLYEWLEHRLYW